MKKLITLIVSFAFVLAAVAQHEKVLPVNGNIALSSNQNNRDYSPKNLFKTSAIWPAAFPLVSQFNNDSLHRIFWVDSNVQINANAAIFNAQNFSNNTYSNADNTFGVNDELTSSTINLINVFEVCYVSITYQTGATWQANDSLVLQALNAAGNWDNIWRSVPGATDVRNAQINLPLGLLYQHAGFKLRMVNYSTRSASNNQNYLLHNLVFAPKQTWPYYENMYWNTPQTWRRTWSKMQGDLRTDADIKFGNVIKLDAFDQKGAAYNNGFNDTIQSHVFDMSTLAANDSVFFRFYYKAISTQTTDSLIVQFKNNAGIWTTQMAFSAASANAWKTYAVNVNKSRFNHQLFEFRILTLGNTNDTLKWLVAGFNINKKLLLPFVDDFAAATVYPDANKWKDKLVYVNNRFPVNPPSLNVATFDGLNAIGVPYGVGRGYCDTLTSLPIRLDGLTLADSVYLSFFVQPQGLGMVPDLGDTLSLFARYSAASPDSFNLLWRAAPGSFVVDSFIQVRIALPAIYLHDEFQLRFINKGSKTGNLNHWHIDYVYLNKGRNKADAITDLAIQNPPSPLIKKFASMPYAHFKNSASTYTLDTQYFAVRNNSNQSYAIDYGREIFDQNFARIDSFGSIISIMPAQETRSANMKRSVNFAGNFNTDSVLIWSRYYTRLGTTFDNIRANDTIWQSTYFGNYYAYDDGTAEAGYAIENAPGKVALRFPFAQPDSMYGISFSLNRSKIDVAGLFYNLMVWSTLGATSNTEQVLMRIPATVFYQDPRNNFYYAKFEKPIYIQNEVYIGWEQTSVFPLNMGLDLNFMVNNKYAPNPEMFYNVQDLWQPTELNGALMMRPIVGKWKEPTTGVNENTTASKLEISLYPNPTAEMLTIAGKSNALYSVVVYDITGKINASYTGVQQQIDLQHLTNGMYLVRVTDETTQATSTQKIIIQH